MRITLVSPEYPPAERMGGIGTNSATLSRALAARGHEVSVVTRGESDSRYVDDGVTVVRLKQRWVPNPHVQRLAARRRIAAAVRRLRPDVVQAAEWEAEAWWVARFGGAPVVTRLATPTYMLEELNAGGVDRASAVVRRLERDQTRRSRTVYAPTAAMADRVARDWEIPRSTIEVIPNSIDVEWVRRAGASEPPHALPPRYIVFLGRMERRKGIEVIGRALPDVLRALPDLHAILIGRDPKEEDGKLMARFARAVGPVAERVHLLGELPRAQALAVVARAEISLVPSLWENFGYVCVEAMALGVPVVVSKAGGLVEIVTHEDSGWLVPPGDDRALSETLIEKLSTPTEMERVAAGARRRAADFEVNTVVDRVEELLARTHKDGGGMTRDIYHTGYREHFKAEDRRDPFHRLYGRKRDAVLEHFARAERKLILDAGGGYGRLAGPLATNHDVVLCDISIQMLHEARLRYRDGARLIQADARTLPFESERFDAVLALDLIVHLPDLGAAVSELARVVRRGGELVFDTTNVSPWWVPVYPSYWNFRPKRLALTMRAGGILPEWRTVVRHQRPDQVRAAIAAAGLRLESAAGFGPPWSPKWHLWRTTKPGAV